MTSNPSLIYTDVEIQPISENDLLLWSELWMNHWNSNSNSIITRTHDVEYYKYRFFNNGFNRAFKCIYKKQTIGFCGIKVTSNIEKCIIHEYVDVIFDSKFRNQGLFQAFFKKLVQESKNVDAIYIYPINREAYISWKFMLDIKVITPINRWLITLPEEFKCNFKTTLLVEENLNNGVIDDYLKWRYLDHPEKHRQWGIKHDNIKIGRVFFKVINNSSKNVLEINSISIIHDLKYIQLKEIIELIISYSLKKRFNNLIIRVLKGGRVDRYISSLNLNKENEKLYALQVDLKNNKNNNYLKSKIIIGEDLDTPRAII